MHTLRAAVDSVTLASSTDAQTHTPASMLPAPLPVTDTLTDAAAGSELLSNSDYLSRYVASAAAALEATQQQELLCLGGETQPREHSLQWQWESFRDQVQQAFRARLPDPQSLIALLANLHKVRGMQPENRAAGAAGTAGNVPYSSDPEDSAVAGHETPNLDVEMQPGCTGTGQLQGVVLGSSGEMSMPAAGMVRVVLYTLLAKYQDCLPEAVSDSHIDVVGLMPQVRIPSMEDKLTA